MFEVREGTVMTTAEMSETKTTDFIQQTLIIVITISMYSTFQKLVQISICQKKSNYF